MPVPFHALLRQPQKFTWLSTRFADVAYLHAEGEVRGCRLNSLVSMPSILTVSNIMVKIHCHNLPPTNPLCVEISCIVSQDDVDLQDSI